MGYEFEWDWIKAESNFCKHGVTFDEATTAFGDPMVLLMADPDHSFGEHRYCCLECRIVVDSSSRPLRNGRRGLALFQQGRRLDRSGGDMKRKASRRRGDVDRDTMRPEYDFSKAVRGATAARYAQGTNVVVIDPEVLDALRALAPVMRKRRRPARRRRSA